MMTAPARRTWRSAMAVVLETNEDMQGVMVLVQHATRAQFNEPQFKLAAGGGEPGRARRQQRRPVSPDPRPERPHGGAAAHRAGRSRKELRYPGRYRRWRAAGGCFAAWSCCSTAPPNKSSVCRATALGQPLTQIGGAYGGAAQWVTALNNWVRNPRRDAQAELLLDRLEVGDRVVSVHASPVYNRRPVPRDGFGVPRRDPRRGS